ncbi:VOC family protein [Dehalobacter sp. DCM]|uniref:VOC family protein n=1 Tax=Dehalobacter sp. DCM TaxID=2907827 RepID=UPI003081E5A9|nr:VOC family protein [Dehalobacter sp. DCM]
MKICWAMIMVKNMDESIRFYHEILGLPIIKRFGGKAGPEIAFLGDGETQIELVCQAGKEDIDIGPDISIGFEVPFVDDLIDDLMQKGIAIASGPFQPNAKLKFFYVHDPNGLSVQFVQRNTD